MPFMGDSDWSTPSTGEWSDSLYISVPKSKSKTSAKPQRPAYLKHQTHASMPNLSEVEQYVFRPATYADKVDRLRNPPVSKPTLKRTQSLTTPASTSMAAKVEKHVHFVDEGYGSASTSPASSPKQEPKRDDSRPSTSDSDFEQLVSQQQKMTLDERPSKPQRNVTDVPPVKAQSRSPTRSAKRLSRSQTAPMQSNRRAQARDDKIAGTGGSYRNANGNICFDEFNYFGGI
ncbi:Translation initiation factor if-2 [Lasiodiplodia theobromae]|uniref:Uncharacterized protein n=1 Tax=Lasiodiplodia theobromae TaxID=45133 RepID=A0A5N5DNM6_9PEZI|nr:Translation initiation factor if-2 [Lasiodiplodia theobromae]KAB2578394.1 hypothetical protein DBV05_g2937 [Lasiodiplodia theobromae]KAF4544883.1 Translation initiation factor if-2 [Lasiodiplodia theobromae]